MTPDRKANPDKMGAASAPTRTTSRLAVSAPAGLAVLLILGTVAFGHEGLFPRRPDADAGNAAPTAQATPKPVAVAATPKPEATPKPAATPKAAPIAQATPKPEVIAATPKPAPIAATPKPMPAVTPRPQPAPQTSTLTLSVLPSERADKVQLGWTAYSGAGFHYYKLVRSHDASATWPTSGDDQLIAAIGNVAETGMRDRPDCGVTVFYRVFAVKSSDAGYQVLAASNTVSATTTCPPPPPPQPATQHIGLEASFAEGKVNLAWSPCAIDGFNAWKIVRSQTNAEPMYPENAGTELIAAIGDPNQTWFSDGAVASGQTWYYRVLARADQGGGNFIACQSLAVAVTIP